MKDDDMEQMAARASDRKPAREGWIWRVIFEPSVAWGVIGVAYGTTGLWMLWRLGSEVRRLADIMEVHR